MNMKPLFNNLCPRTSRNARHESGNGAAARSRVFFVTLTGLAAAILAATAARAQMLEWAVSYNGIPASALEEAEGVVVDASGNVFATGLSGQGSGSAIC